LDSRKAFVPARDKDQFYRNSQRAQSISLPKAEYRAAVRSDVRCLAGSLVQGGAAWVQEWLVGLNNVTFHVAKKGPRYYFSLRTPNGVLVPWQSKLTRDKFFMGAEAIVKNWIGYKGQVEVQPSALKFPD
jgi:hypothetical protein